MYLLHLNYVKHFKHYITTGVGLIPGKSKNKIKEKRKKRNKQHLTQPLHGM